MSSDKQLLALEEFVQEIELIQDFDEKAEILIELSESYVPVPVEVSLKPYAKENLVPGCESEVYYWLNFGSDLKAKLYFAVENPQGISAKAMAALLCKYIVGQAPESIARLDDNLAYRIFGKTLTMGRALGLRNMIQVLKSSAKQHLP